jgi:hypothetical protein
MAIGAFGPWASALGGVLTVSGTSGQRDGWLVLVASGIAAVCLLVNWQRPGGKSQGWAGTMAFLGGGVCVYDLVDITNKGYGIHPDWGIYVALAGAVTAFIAALRLPSEA